MPAPTGYIEIDTVSALSGNDFLEPQYINKMIEKIAPDKALLLRFMQESMGSTFNASANVYRQLINAPINRTITISGFSDASDTSTTILESGAYSQFKNGASFMVVTTGEVFRLPTAPTSNSLSSIERGSYFAGAVASGTPCIFIGQTAREFDYLADPVQNIPGYRSYYIGHFHRGFALTDLSGKNQTWARMPEKVRIDQDAAWEFAVDVNQQLLWGTPTASTEVQTGGTYDGTMTLYVGGGMYFYAKKRNNFIPGDVLNMKGIQNFVGATMQVGRARSKRIHCDGNTINYVSQFAVQQGIARQDASKRAIVNNVNEIVIPIYGEMAKFVYDAEVDRVSKARIRAGLPGGIMIALDYSVIQEVNLTGGQVADGMLTQSPEQIGRYGNRYVLHTWKGVNPGLEEAHGVCENYEVVEAA